MTHVFLPVAPLLLVPPRCGVTLQQGSLGSKARTRPLVCPTGGSVIDPE